MKKLWISAACGALALGACSQAERGDDQQNYETTAIEAADAAGADAPKSAMARADAAADTASSEAAAAVTPTASASPSGAQSDAPPQISTKASSRVAFAHNYLFDLPSKNISAVQEQHSRQCEELGPTQCEITDMDYRLASNGNVEASISFILAPRVANMFGTSAVSAVNKAEGELVEGTMRGEDAGGEIQQLEAGDVERMRQLRELERRRDGAKAGSRERAQLEEEISALNNAGAESKQAQNNAQARLNWTPVTFTYESRTGLFGAGNGDGLAGNGAASLSAMLSLVAIIAPWLLLFGVIVWVWRRFGGSGRGGAASNPTAESKSS